MADEIPKGRARGRARGRPVVEDPVDVMRRPGMAPPSVRQSLGIGRGRGTSADDAPVQGGRSKPRASCAGARLAGVGDVTKSMAATVLSSSSSDSGSTAEKKSSGTGNDNGDNGNGNGDGNGNGNVNGNGNGNGDHPASVGRGAKRGRPVDSQDGILRTIPSGIESKQGIGGTPLELRSNYFALKKLPDWRLYQYRVDMSPEIDYTKERKYHVYQNKDLMNIWFDGTMLISINPLAKQDEKIEFTSTRKSDDQIVKVTIRLVGEVHPTSPVYLQFLNIIIRGMMSKLNLDLIGRNYYDSKAAIRDPKLMKHKLELYPGYVTSIRQHEQQVLLNVEISHKILRTDTVYDMIRTIPQIRNMGKAQLQDRLEKTLLGEIIITKYNNITYKISDILLDMNPASTFEDKKGNKVKFCDYYLSRWGMKIQDLDQCLIASVPKEKDAMGGVRAPIMLVPELCYMTGLSDGQKSDFNLMKDLGEYTRQNPAKRAQALMQFSKRLTGTPEIKELLEKWNMKFDTELQKVPGRLLPPEEILGDKGSRTTYKGKADWGSAFRSWKCTSVVSLTRWGVIVPKTYQPNLSKFLEQLYAMFKAVGMTVSPAKIEVITDNKLGSYKACLDTLGAMNLQMLMVVIPNKMSSDIYSMIKKTCCVTKPIPSQVMTSTILGKEKGLSSVATKVALQMNCKMGGELWSVKIPLPGCMVIGFDTYHDSQMKGRSVGALVASINDNFTKYFSATEFHDVNGAQEISEKITGMVSTALEAYKTVNGNYPKRIFFYRDGVGDGQIPFVYHTEVQALKAAIKRISPETKLTFIIVSKRINTRFFTAKGNPDNPPSGTVVDAVVTLPERYDFYLVSQSVGQGTVNPTSYNVILDESGMAPDKIQKLSYKLTHLYYNWPGTVRVPAPVQYSHKLAFLVGTSLHTQPSRGLENLLYYL